MLRRYNSTNLDTLVMKNRKTTIGSSPSCDVVVKGRGVSAIHASIESNSLGFWLKEHSLSGITKVNDQQIVGQIELQSGDLIQIGAVNKPFVFESQWLIGSRPTSGKPVSSDNSLPSIMPKRITPTSKRKRSLENGSSLRSSGASSTESSAPRANSRGSVGSNLLQRVIRLQAELINRDEKIRQLSTIPQPTFYHPHQSLLRPRLELLKPPTQPNFELCAYRGFLSAIAAQLRGFNERVLKNPQREYAEVFSAMCRACDVPLQTRIMEIEKHIEIVLIDSDFEENDELLAKLNSFIRESRREKILELTQELEIILPVIRDAASNARENAKVCAVFTQWSRQFGDVIRTAPCLTSEILLKAIEDLKKQFAEAHMSRHWLPPSITPIFRLAALELEKSTSTCHNSNEISNIGHVECLQHEMSYQIKNLETNFQENVKDEVTARKLSKLVENLGNDYRKLMELTGVSESRKNSVLVFEITPEDITNGRNSQPDQRVSPPLNDYTQQIEILNEKCAQVLGAMAPEVGASTRKVQISEKLLKELLANSMRLLDERGSYRRKRSLGGPMILVNEVDDSKNLEDGVDLEERLDEVASLEKAKKFRKFKVKLGQSPEPEHEEKKSEDAPRALESLEDASEVAPTSESASGASKPMDNAPEASQTSENISTAPECFEHTPESHENAPEVVVNSESLNNAPETHESAPEASKSLKDAPDGTLDIRRTQNAPEDTVISESLNGTSEFYRNAPEVSQTSENVSTAPEYLGNTPDVDPKPSESIEHAPEVTVNPESLNSAPESHGHAPEASQTSENVSTAPESFEHATEALQRLRNSDDASEKVTKSPEVLIKSKSLKSAPESFENAPEVLVTAKPLHPAPDYSPEVLVSSQLPNGAPEDSHDAPESFSSASASSFSRTPPESPEIHLDLTDVPENSIDSPETRPESPAPPTSQVPPSLSSEDLPPNLRSPEPANFYSPPPRPGFESHWKSHQNTATGKPNIVYQYPHHFPRHHTSPLTHHRQIRSKSEDQQRKNKTSRLANRPPFVLY